MEKVYKSIETAVMSQYENRLKSTPRDTINMLDLLIEQNKTCNHEDKWSTDEIVGSFILLQFAGSDTSKEISSYFLNYLGSNQPMQEMLLKELDEQIYSNTFINYETLDKSPVFNMHVYEALRFFSPFTNTSPRKIVKECKLGKYHIKKGTNLVLPIGNMMI